MVRALSPSPPPLTLPHHTITTHPLIAPSCSSTVPCHIITSTPHIPTHHTMHFTPHTNSYYTITSTLHTHTLHHHLPHIPTYMYHHHPHSSHPHITPSPPLFLPQCGNDIKEEGEACDGEDFGRETCHSSQGTMLVTNQNNHLCL